MVAKAFAAISVAIAALSVAACSGQSVAVPGSGMREPGYETQDRESRPLSLQFGGAPAQTGETVLHSFAGGSDGEFPEADLTNVNGVLYGTTVGKNSKNGCSSEYTCGIVFTITTSGTESVLYHFAGGSDGALPYSGLINVNGVLYGTTSSGGGKSNCAYQGAAHCGAVFTITTSGTENILYRFAGGTDGALPFSAFTNVNGVLYGTTSRGGAYGVGTVYKITTLGAESVLYSFKEGIDGGSDGALPYSGLTNVNGVLYGTTIDGGTNDSGTVFKITTSGSESVLHSFGSGNDGTYPASGLTDVNGVLYGTTFSGGAGSRPGFGTVYKISTSGVESVLYSFGGGNDGIDPAAGLTNVNGVLYGTTSSGGGNTCRGEGCGTVFKVTTIGAESVLYSFAGGSDGANPSANLINVNGVLYGTTFGGGANGKGTVFSLPI